MDAQEVATLIGDKLDPEAIRKLQTYTTLFVAIDGSLQCEEQHVDVRYGPGKVRVYVRWAVPASGFEWDGREHAGTEREFQVVVFGSDYIVKKQMRCVWFAVRHAVNEAATARAIFEATE